MSMEWMDWEDAKLIEYRFYDNGEIADRILPHRSVEAVRKRRHKTNLEQLAHCKKCSTPIRKHTQQTLCTECKSTEEKSTTVKARHYEYIRSAKKRNIEWGLTLSEFAAMWNSNCSYCDDTIATIGIDRIDNTKGYVAGNVTPCCNVCNSMKSGLTHTDWVNQMRRILNHLEGSKNGD